MENAASWPVCQNTKIHSIIFINYQEHKSFLCIEAGEGQNQRISSSLQTKFQIPSKVQGRREPLKQNRR